MMHPLRRRRLSIIVIAIGILGVVSCLVMYALRQNINLFFTPSQLSGQNLAHDKLIRLGGLVVAGSVQRNSDSLDVNFKITDNKRDITIAYNGVLPDLFREGQSIVTQGYLVAPDRFEATEVLAKHDENYMPKEIKSVISKNSSTKASS